MGLYVSHVGAMASMFFQWAQHVENMCIHVFSSCCAHWASFSSHCSDIASTYWGSNVTDADKKILNCSIYQIIYMIYVHHCKMVFSLVGGFKFMHISIESDPFPWFRNELWPFVLVSDWKSMLYNTTALNWVLHYLIVSKRYIYIVTSSQIWPPGALNGQVILITSVNI